MRRAARHAFDGLVPGAEVCDLVADSALGRPDPGRAWRRLRFQGPRMGVQVDAVPGSTGVELMLQVLDAGRSGVDGTCDVEVLSQGRCDVRLAVTTDRQGKVRMRAPAAVVSFVVRPHDGAPGQTAWVLL